MAVSAILRQAIDETPWIDTHEHLVEEAGRLRPDPYVFTDVWGEPTCIPAGWTCLLAHYAIDDLIAAGLPAAAARTVIHSERDPVEHWDAVAPYLEAARAGGYLRAVDISTERLFGIRAARDTCREIDRRLRELRAPGYYEHVLHEVANVERCHVNSLEQDPFCETAHPGLLDQDLSLFPLVTGIAPAAERASGLEVASLAGYVELVEWCFERFARGAVAVKLLWAYFRSVAVRPVDAPPNRAFARLRAGTATADERRAVEDYLLACALALATEYGLPVKLHLGYLAGNRRAGLERVFSHVADTAPLLHAHPHTTFVLMHMAWPHQEELLTLVKHFPNAVVDLCWAWILAPLATRDFVRRFLTTAPASKLMCFGGDYLTVETVVGHAELARRGLRAALELLTTEDEWLTPDEALALVPSLMRDNARRSFPAM